MRKLATIRRISELLPIPNKDLICVAIVDGWSVIVKKSEFKVGDLCVFFEIDSFIPVEDSRFSFLERTKTTYEGKEGYRLKTMKMSGVISQGLALPLLFFKELLLANEGDDVSDILKIIKYDNQNVSQKDGSPTAKVSGRDFPKFLRETDQERIQNLTHYFKTFEDIYFEETLKLDGSSLTAYKVDRPLTLVEKVLKFFGFTVDPTQFGVCSRNLNLNKDTSAFWTTALKYKLDTKVPVGYAVQGELIGPSIQSNHEKVTDYEFYIFDVFNIKEQRYLTPSERMSFVAAYGLPHVPVVNSSVQVFKECSTVAELLARVEGCSMNPGTVSEGRVYKALDKPITFKAISNSYLLKHER